MGHERLGHAHVSTNNKGRPFPERPAIEAHLIPCGREGKGRVISPGRYGFYLGPQDINYGDS